MNKEYVQQYVRLEKEHWWFVVRQKIILQFLGKNISHQPLNILNIGAAGGASTKWLSGLGSVVSVETEPYFIEHLKQCGIDPVNASVTALPFADNSFDLVCAFDVLEHVKDDGMAMKEMSRVCKIDGIVCVTVPAAALLWSAHDVVNGHYRRYSKRTLCKLADNFPLLNKIDSTYFNTILFLPIFIARKMQGKGKIPRSDFDMYNGKGLFGRICKAIFGIEVPLLRSIHFPFGVSLIAAWKKIQSK